MHTIVHLIMSGRKQAHEPIVPVSSAYVPKAGSTHAPKAPVVWAHDIANFMNKLQRIIPHYDNVASFTAANIRPLINDIRRLLPPNIKVSYEIGGSVYGSRVKWILASRRDKVDFNIPLARQSNGLIFEVYAKDDHWMTRILCMPPCDLGINPSHETLAANITAGRYDIFNVEDGTVFNMYWDESIGRWIRSTKNSVNIDELEWRGYSYVDIIDDVLAYKFTADTWAIMQAKLRKDLTYSFAYKHPAHHPYGQPDIWKIGDKLESKVSKSTTKWIADLWLVAVHDHKGRNIEGVDAAAPISRRVPISFNLTLKDMLERNNDATPDCPSGLTSGPSRHIPHFGYILRSKDHTLPDIILESNIWRSIRQTIYQMPHANSSQEYARIEDRFKAIHSVITDIFISDRRALFVKLFPQYANKIADYEERVNKLAIELTGSPTSAAGQRFAAVMANQFKPTGNPTDINVIKAFITQPSHAAILDEVFS